MTSWSECPTELWPREIIFFSADLVGSTPLKQKPIRVEDGIVIPDRTEWFLEIQDFYLRAVAHFMNTCRKHISDHADEDYVATMMPPRVWKTVGDEVLFWAAISDSRQVIDYVKCWIKAMKDLRERSEATLGPTAAPREKRRKHKDPVDVKCCAWIAHFPWRNKIIFTSKEGLTGAQIDGIVDNNLQLLKSYFQAGIPNQEADLIPDFVGPGIDIGFRLAQQASPRRFFISTDVAYMLAKVVEAEHRRQDLPGIHFEGLHILKGVLGGLEYPMFWIDMSSPDDIDSYGSDLKERQYCKANDIVSFMDRFYNRRSNYMYPPFIVSKTERLLTDEPKWYYDTHMAMVRETFPTEGATA